EVCAAGLGAHGEEVRPVGERAVEQAGEAEDEAEHAARLAVDRRWSERRRADAAELLGDHEDGGRHELAEADAPGLLLNGDAFMVPGERLDAADGDAVHGAAVSGAAVTGASV